MFGVRSCNQGTAITALPAALTGCLCMGLGTKNHNFINQKGREMFCSWPWWANVPAQWDGVTEQCQWDSKTLNILLWWAPVSVLQLPLSSSAQLKQLGDRTFQKEKKCRIYQITCFQGGLRSLHLQRQLHTVVSPPHAHFPVSEGYPKGNGITKLEPSLVFEAAVLPCLGHANLGPLKSSPPLII